MSPRFPRRRDSADEPADDKDDDDAVRLDDADHAWWSQRTPEELLAQRREVEDPGPERDVLAEHLGKDWETTFEVEVADEPPPSADTSPAPRRTGGDSDILAEAFGEDWRTSFDMPAPPPRDTRPEPEPKPEPEPDLVVAPDAADPYAVLGIEQTATWEEIVAVHRKLARKHHPDRLAGRGAAEVEAGEELIRVINAAYAELRVRRGR